MLVADLATGKAAMSADMNAHEADGRGMFSVEIWNDDHLLICSNGLSDKVASDEISVVIRQSDNLTDACERLIEIANERGGEDNITVMLARMSGAAHSLPFASANTGCLKLVA